MGYFEIFLTGMGLAMDAFAVSVCKGIQMTRLKWRYIFTVGIFFGGFQMLMPFIGWLLGAQLVNYISAFDHWIAFFLLLFIGGKMALGALQKDSDTYDIKADGLDIRELFLLAIATSIDALAAGLTFSLYPDISIASSIAIIGAITFILCFLGVIIGNKFGTGFKSIAELIGGLVLIGLGIKLLAEGLLT